MTNIDTHLSPLWLIFAVREILGKNVISLLRNVRDLGSITKAANATPMSYKKAWDLIDHLNNISPRPIVTARTGGKDGGGCSLTDYGTLIVSAYDTYEQLYQRLSRAFAIATPDFSEFDTLVKQLIMKTSARNQFTGTVTKLRKGNVSAEVVIRISDHDLISASVTNKSVESLGIKEGDTLMALLKASSIILMSTDGPLKTSAINRLCGTVASITQDVLNSEVKVALEGDKSIVAVVTNQSVVDLGLREGSPVCAIFSDSQVILAVNA